MGGTAPPGSSARCLVTPGRNGPGRGLADRQDQQPCSGGGVHPFYLESIIASDDCAVLRIEGDIDAYAAPQLRDRVTGLAGIGAVHIIADMRGTEFLDSAGLGALVGSRTVLRARGGSLTLVVSASRILQTIRIAGLAGVFALYSRVPDAIAADQHWQAAVSGEGDSAEQWCRKHGLL